MISPTTLIKTHWVLLTITLLSAITLLSLWPADQISPMVGADKINHLIAYACLMLPAGIRKPKTWLLLAILFIFYSGAIELVQPLVNRSAEWLDLLANALGVVCGAAAGLFLNFLAQNNTPS